MTQVVFPATPNVRYTADSESRALICLDPKATVFATEIDAKIINESYSGCSVALAEGDELTEGALVICQTGPLAPLQAEVIWCRVGEHDQLEAGLRYLD